MIVNIEAWMTVFFFFFFNFSSNLTDDTLKNLLEPTCKIYSLPINLQNLIVYFNPQFAPQIIILQYAKNVYSILNSTLLPLILFYSI
jgi:hypothetical protein